MKLYAVSLFLKCTVYKIWFEMNPFFKMRTALVLCNNFLATGWLQESAQWSICWMLEIFFPQIEIPFIVFAKFKILLYMLLSFLPSYGNFYAKCSCGFSVVVFFLFEEIYILRHANKAKKPNHNFFYFPFAKGYGMPKEWDL